MQIEITTKQEPIIHTVTGLRGCPKFTLTLRAVGSEAEITLLQAHIASVSIYTKPFDSQ